MDIINSIKLKPKLICGSIYYKNVLENFGENFSSRKCKYHIPVSYQDEHNVYTAKFGKHFEFMQKCLIQEK